MLSASSSKMAPTLARESELASVTNGGQQAVNGNEQIKEETWSTILQGVASTKIVPTKNVLILGTQRFDANMLPREKNTKYQYYLKNLGDPHSGKSTLIHYIKHDPGPKPVSADSEQDEQQPTPLLNVATSQVTPMSVDNLDEDTKNELALGFTYVEVADDENEGKDQCDMLKYYMLKGSSIVARVLIMKISFSGVLFRYHCALGAIPTWPIRP
jgi:hypothetical protein